MTADRNLPFQQNLAALELAIVVLTVHPNRIQEMRPLIPELLKAIEVIKPGEILSLAA